MNLIKQQIAIGKACGHAAPSPVPDYLNDLNSLADARNALITTPELTIEWVHTLRKVIGSTSTNRNKIGQALVSDIDLLFSDSRQLAQTLLKTLKLWEDV